LYKLYCFDFFITGIWYWWIEQQDTPEVNAQMDEGEEDAEAALQPYWFEQEISANYFA
jgi:hypothetical protein